MDYTKDTKENLHSPGQLPSVFQDDADEADGSNRVPSEYVDSANRGPSEYFDSAIIMEEGYEDGPRLQKRNNDHCADALRSGQRLNRADPTQVEGRGDDDEPNMSKNTKEKIEMKDIVNIFIDDKKIMAVSPQQLHRVKKMHKKIDDGASFSFNYNTLLAVASIIAGLGLVSNSGAIIIASMLVSPLMGPVVGLAYGTTINDWKLVRKSLKTECVSLLVCIVAGFLIGAVIGPTSVSDDWPTQEMENRGTMTNFYLALPIAFVSGLGVAVSLLDEQTSSLVGVAISASLLPPAVNAGIMWIAVVFVESDVLLPTTCYENTTENFNATQENALDLCTEEDHSEQYDEFNKGGAISLVLTLANIFLIWLSGMFMFRMKEVLPIRKTVFWEDLGVARRVYTHTAVLSRENFAIPAETMDEEKDEEAASS